MTFVTSLSLLFECRLYGNYLFRDGVMIVRLPDQELSANDFMLKFPIYNTFIQGLVSTYNQNFLNNNTGSGVKLLMQIDQPEIRLLYPFDARSRLHSKSDHGINLLFPADMIVPAKAIGFTIDFGVICESLYSTGYILMPRSSIGKTPLRQANCIGLIESTYRGHLMAKVDNVSDQPYIILKGTSLFQLAHANLVNEWSVQLVLMCGQTQRGAGGFGSTGK
jgi:dUTP pyrophosphatase